MLNVKTMLAGGMLACFFTAATTFGQTGPIGGGSQPPVGGLDKNTVQLNDFNMPQMLQQLGHKVSTRKNNNGLNYWVVTAQQNGWGFVVEVVPQRNNGKIIGLWFISDLGQQLNNPNALNAQALLKLMEKSHSIAPYFFSYNPRTKHIAMNYEWPNGRISQSTLSQQMNNFFNKIRDTYNLWDTKVVMGKGSNPPPFPNPNPNPNPFPKPNPNPIGKVNLTGTQWVGSETLQGFGKLTFQFNAGGKATMIDTAGVSQGTWKQNGNQVTIQFFNGKVTYSGTMKGNTISGQASNTAGATWSFSVSKK